MHQHFYKVTSQKIFATMTLRASRGDKIITQKKYCIYGIGNAVVDLEWEVPLSFLSDQDIEKGLMTLVNGQRQEQILRHSDNPYQHCGGSAANTLIAMAHLGSRAFFNCKLARDSRGEMYLKNLEQYGIQSPGLASAGEAPTATCLVMITPDADRTMQTHLGIASELSPEDIRPEELAASENLYVEGYLASDPKGLKAAIKAMELARAHNVRTILSLSDPSMAKYFRPQLLEIIGENKLDLLLCNADEALLLAQERDLPRALKKLSSMTTAMAVTCGPKGVIICENEREWSVLAPKVEAVNTNGAGDLFAGAYLFALTRGHSAPDAAAFACSAASLLVTRPGSRLKKDDLKKLYADFYRQQ